MENRGLMWGLALGVLAALTIILMSVGTLETLVTRSGLAAVLPAAQPPLGDTARYMLAALAFALPTVIGTLIGSRREEGEIEEDYAAAPLPVAEQTVSRPMAGTAVNTAVNTAAPVATPAVSPSRGSDAIDARLARIEAALAELPTQMTRAIKTSPSADLDKTLRSIQRAMRKRLPDPSVLNAVRSLQSDAGPEALIARIEAIEAHLGEQLAQINARLAMLGGQSAEAPLPPLVRLPTRRPDGLASRRIGETVADIRRSIESLNG